MKKSTENVIANKVKSDLRGITMSTLIDAGVPRTRNSQFAFPLSQFSEVYGQGLLLRVAWEAYIRLGANPENTATGHVHFHDVEAYLNEELHAAYELLEAPGNEHLWQLCNQNLAKAIRSRDRQEIIRIQRQFFSEFLNSDARNTTTAAYAWAILVEAALLNERLVRDVRETSTNRGCPCMLTEWMPFYLPDPPVEARETFKAYINCRWPIYTFALDPVIQEQYVGERFSRRREFQLALAVGVSTGQIAANQLSRFARRLELDMETIDLNRTITGFSHGNNQFGWRFTPRVQVPTVEGNLTVAFRELLVGGPSRDCDLRRTRLEPGTRECIALVVRPSMIPRFVLDMRTNWFRLTDPKTTVMSLKSTVDLSRTIRGMQDCAAVCVQDAAAYRDGELHRLLRRVDQLSAELPLQTMHYDVPLENVLGGFRMFNGSSTDLSPQLYSWYGEPGINVMQDTTIFLTGERFSVQGTRVVVGNKSIGPGDYVEEPPKPADSKPKSDSPAATAANSATVTATVTATAQTPGAASATTATSPAPASSGGAKPQTPRMELLSRRIMKVIIPANVRTYPGTNPNGKPQPYVDLHIATPYGVTQKLSIPVIEAPPAAKDIAKAIEDHEKKRHFDTFAWENKDVQATVQYNDVTHHVSSFDFATKSVAIQKSAVSPRVTQPVGIEVAFWIAMKAKGKDKKPVQMRDASGKLVNAVVGPVRAMLGPDGTAVLSDRTKAQSDLADAILRIIGDSTGYAPFTSDDNIESLELDGFVRAVDGTPFGNQTPADGLPVVRLEDPLTIKLVTGKPAAAVSAVTPFSQPSVQPAPAATPVPTTPSSPATAPKESTPSNSLRSPESQPTGPNLGASNASHPWPAAPQRVSAVPPGGPLNRRASAEVAFDRAGGKPMRNLSSPAARTMPVARQTRRSDTVPEIGSGAREIVPVEFTFDSRTGR